MERYRTGLNCPKKLASVVERKTLKDWRKIVQAPTKAFSRKPVFSELE